MKKIIPKIIGWFFNVLTPIFPRMTREMAFNLLCRVKKLPLTEEGKTFFDSGSIEYIDINNEKTAIHKWGFGPKKIVFLHGWMSHSQRWRQYIEALPAHEFTCYSVDAPGHGASEGNFLNLEIYRQAYEQAISKIGRVDVLVGHSLGNLVAAYQFLLSNDIPVKSYVVLGTPSGMDALYVYFQEILGLSKPMLQNLSVKINEILRIPADEIMMANFFSKTESPILLVHEESDPITPIAPIKNIVSEGKNITTHYTNGLSHTLKSDEVLELVTNFIIEQTENIKTLEYHVFERV